MSLERDLTQLAVQPATPGELQLPSIYLTEVLKIAMFVRARAVPGQKEHRSTSNGVALQKKLHTSTVAVVAPSWRGKRLVMGRREETNKLVCLARTNKLVCLARYNACRAVVARGLPGSACGPKGRAKNAVKQMTTCHARFMRTETVQTFEQFCKTQNRDHGRHRTETMGETEGTGASEKTSGTALDRPHSLGPAAVRDLADIV